MAHICYGKLAAKKEEALDLLFFLQTNGILSHHIFSYNFF